MPLANGAGRPDGDQAGASGSRQRSWWRRRRLWAGAVAAGLLLGGAGLWMRQRASPQADIEPFTVVARSGDLPGVVNAAAALEAEQRVNVS
ncbi:MAG: efflux RND transporter periplasmic adaptor subunit, partial [Cyanobium sp.]